MTEYPEVASPVYSKGSRLVSRFRDRLGLHLDLIFNTLQE
jgi:hypothetical protein